MKVQSNATAAAFSWRSQLKLLQAWQLAYDFDGALPLPYQKKPRLEMVGLGIIVGILRNVRE